MPQLKCVSVFVQGPLRLRQTCKGILDTVAIRIASASRSLYLFFLRLPNPLPTPPYRTVSISDLENMINAQNPTFSVVRPVEVANEERTDVDVGVDVGWRCGTLFLPSDEGVSEKAGGMMKRYVVWTPPPRGLTWPCRF